jgi:uncharacterized membrane protein YidH (DUF202 family)
MEKIKKYLEYQTAFALIVFGLALIVFGIYFFLEIKSAEETGQVVQMKRIVRAIYNLGGKFTILAIFEIIGIMTLVSGIRQFKEINSNSNKSL